MGYITGKKNFIQQQLTSVEARITKYETALETMNETGAESYKFDSGEGSQMTKRRSLKEIEDILERLYARWNHLYNKLYGMGLVAVNLRRKKPNGLF